MSCQKEELWLYVEKLKALDWYYFMVLKNGKDRLGYPQMNFLFPPESYNE
jgi:hypothetical protein